MIFKGGMQVELENQADVINFVSRGMVPSKKDFQSLIGAIESRSSDVPPVDPETNDGTQAPTSSTVILRNGITFDMDDDALINALDQVYKNRVHNRNVMIGIGIAVGTLLFIGGTKQHNRIKELEAECEHLKEDLPVVEVTPL